MKLLFDNNLSPKIANAVKALCCGEKCEVVHLKEKFKADTKDEEWLSTLIEEGGWSILSIDRFKKNPVEKEALNSPRLTVFIFARGWSDLGFWEQSYKIIRWIPQIIKQTELNSSGVFEIPVQYGPGKFKQMSAKYRK